MNTTVKNTGGDASSLNGKSEMYNKLANITIALLLESIENKDFFKFDYQYAIWLYRLNANRLRGDVPYFLWHETIPSYKHV